MTIPAHVNLIGWDNGFASPSNPNPYGFRTKFIQHGWDWFVSNMERAVNARNLRDPETGKAWVVVHHLCGTYWNIPAHEIPERDFRGWNKDGSLKWDIPVAPSHHAVRWAITGHPEYGNWLSTRGYADSLGTAIQRLRDRGIEIIPWIGCPYDATTASMFHHFTRVAFPGCNIAVDKGNDTFDHRIWAHQFRDRIGWCEDWNRIGRDVTKDGRTTFERMVEDDIAVMGTVAFNEINGTGWEGIEHHRLVDEPDGQPQLEHREAYSSGNRRYGMAREIARGQRPIALVKNQPREVAEALKDRGYILAFGIYGDWTREQIEHTTHGELPGNNEGSTG